jgi:hypothetical protein
MHLLERCASLKEFRRCTRRDCRSATIATIGWDSRAPFRGAFLNFELRTAD